MKFYVKWEYTECNCAYTENMWYLVLDFFQRKCTVFQRKKKQTALLGPDKCNGPRIWTIGVASAVAAAATAGWAAVPASAGEAALLLLEPPAASPAAASSAAASPAAVSAATVTPAATSPTSANPAAASPAAVSPAAASPAAASLAGAGTTGAAIYETFLVLSSSSQN
jgi:cell division septation protein DedD